MKTIVIFQIGEVVGENCRTLRVQVPDEMDITAFKRYEICSLLEELADDAGIPWVEYESYGTYANRCLVDDGEPEDFKDAPVLQISEAMLTAALADDDLTMVERASRGVLDHFEGVGADLDVINAELQKIATEEQMEGVN